MGDLITEILREKFQEKFSGMGVGYLPIISDDYRIRRTISQSSSDDWDYASFMTRNAEKLPYGINGTVAVPKNGSWVKYEVTLAFKSVSSFDVFRFFYNNADKSSTMQISFDNGTTKKINLESGDDVKELSINVKDSKKVELQFLSGKRPYFYGVSLESNTGIYIDNFSMRGNSGVTLMEISPKTLQECNNYLDYNLIILNYGANVSSPNKGIFTLYENKMVSLIEEFKKIFPNTSFLLVSVADKTIKRGGQFITNPDVPLLLESQKRIAERTGIAFWNLWEAMGGNNSMNTWVNAAPPQALKDYAHFTPEGALRVGELFFDSIIDAFQKYTK
jgi:lysophospholipase L1-like esterase